MTTKEKAKNPKKRAKEKSAPGDIGLYKFIINKYLDPEKISYSRDYRICKILTKKYPERMFWEYLPFPKKKYDSMIALNGKYFKKFFEEQFSLYKIAKMNLQKQEDNIQFNKEILGENKEKQKTPKNIESFLDWEF